MTLLGERVMRPGFGTNTRKTAFENLSTAMDIIRQEIEAGVSTWLTYLYITSIDGTVDPSDGHLNVTVNYRYGNSQTVESVTVKTAVLTQSGNVISEVPNGR
jgi:phage baseplate assembly protein W